MYRALLLTVLFLPAIAAAAAPRTFSELAEQTVGILNGGIGVAIVLGLVIYFYGIATGISKLSSGGADELRLRIVWGLIAIFVMVSVWGIVGLVRNSLFGGGAGGFDGGGGSQGGCTGPLNCLGLE